MHSPRFGAQRHTPVHRPPSDKLPQAELADPATAPATAQVPPSTAPTASTPSTTWSPTPATSNVPSNSPPMGRSGVRIGEKERGGSTDAFQAVSEDQRARVEGSGLPSSVPTDKKIVGQK